MAHTAVARPNGRLYNILASTVHFEVKMSSSIIPNVFSTRIIQLLAVSGELLFQYSFYFVLVFVDLRLFVVGCWSERAKNVKFLFATQFRGKGNLQKRVDDVDLPQTVHSRDRRGYRARTAHKGHKAMDTVRRESSKGRTF